MNNSAEENIPEKINESLSESLKDFYSDRLRFLWEQQIKIIQLVILMSGATIGVLANIGLISENAEKYSREDLLLTAIFLSGLAGLASLLWRFCAQVMMERQIYAEPEQADRYFELTKTPKPYALRMSPLTVAKLNDSLKIISGLLLLSSWLLASTFVAQNLKPGICSNWLFSFLFC